MTAPDTEALLTDLRDLGLAIDRDHDDGVLLNLARIHGLSVYDAAYMEVGDRRALELASLDIGLRNAANAAGIALFGTELS